MALKETIKKMEHLLTTLTKDLVKACKGNKAAAQRVRTGTIKLAKIAKVYRKESVACERKVCKKKPCAKKAKPKVKKKVAPKKKTKKVVKKKKKR